MTNQEIIVLYKYAKDPTAEVTILAELTLKPVKEIIEIIRAAGYAVDEENVVDIGIPGERNWSKWTDAEDKQLIELRKQGLKFTAIDRILHRPKSSSSYRYQRLLKEAANV